MNRVEYEVSRGNADGRGRDSWLGQRVLDPEGRELGTVSAVVTEGRSGVPRWLRVDNGGAEAHIAVPMQSVHRRADHIDLAFGGPTDATAGSTGRQARPKVAPFLRQRRDREEAAMRERDASGVTNEERIGLREEDRRVLRMQTGGSCEWSREERSLP
jgi:hypothetical protein